MRKLIKAIAILLLVGFMQYAEAEVALKVTVEGVDGEMLANVLEYLSIEQYRDYSHLSERLVRDLHKKAAGEIRRALQPFGYYTPTVHSKIQQKESVWHAVYSIELGKPVLIETVDLLISGEGADNGHFKELASHFIIRKGDILNHQRYELAKRSLNDTAMKLGYLTAETISSRVDVYPAKNTATVAIYFDTGPQYLFGKVTFIQDAFDPFFLQRFIPFQQGEPYDISLILELQRTLTDSDYFELVEVSPFIEKAEGLEVPIEIKLIPLKKHKYTFGIGYGTDTGVRGSLGWENRRVNTRGHRFKIGLKPSAIRSSITAEYLIPFKKKLTENLLYTAGWSTEDTETAESQRFYGGIQFSRMRHGWKESLYARYEQEEFTIGDDSGNTTLLIPGISWVRIITDDP
ncbi:MAG: outer membrane protein assembly factor, partial [Candidatus Mariimomonas ferrooxydans]